MKIMKILLTCLLCLDTFNAVPIFAEEQDQPEEVIMVEDSTQEETEMSEVEEVVEEVTPEITVLDEEVVPVEINEIEEIQVEEVSEEVILTEEDIPEENIEEELSSEEIIEITPEPTVEPTSEVISETVPEIELEEMAEPTPEPTEITEAEEELEELEEISEEEVVEEAIEEEKLLESSAPATQITLNSIENKEVHLLKIESDKKQEYNFYFDVTGEDLKGSRKFMEFFINNQTEKNFEFELFDPNGYSIVGNSGIDYMPDGFYGLGYALTYNHLLNLNETGRYTIKIITQCKGYVRFSIAIGEDDYGDDYDDATNIESGKTYNGELNHKNDKDMFQFTAKKTGKLKIIFSKVGEIDGVIDLTVKDKDKLWSWDPLCYITIGKLNAYWGIRDYGRTLTKTINVEKGKTYSFKIDTWDAEATGGKYSLELDFVEAPKMPKVETTAIYNSAHGADIRWKPIDGIRYYGIWRKRTNPITKKVEEKMIQVIDTKSYTTKENGDYKWIDPYLKDKYTDSGNEWQGGWVYYITARSTGNTSKAYNDGKHLDIDGPISNKLNLYRLRNPEIKSVKANGNGKATITWTNVTNAFGYEVQYTLDNGKTWKKVPEVIAARWGNDGREVKDPNYKASVTVSGLPKGQTVNFRIRCRKTNANLGTTWSQYSLWRSTTVK